MMPEDSGVMWRRNFTMKVMKQRHFPGTRDQAVSLRETVNRQLARKAAAEGMVLLKNEGNLLPLKPGTKVALYGVGASKTVKGGTGSGDVNERETVSIFQGMKDTGYVITTEEWIQDYELRYRKAREAWRDEILKKVKESGDSRNFFDIYSSSPFRMTEGMDVEKTDADTAVYVLSRIAGEGADRFFREGDYLLSEEEKRQIKKLCGLYAHVIVAVNAGGPVDLSFMDNCGRIEALLQISQPGMEGGHAFADILSGRVIPSGKLTDTWAYRYGDYPFSEEFSHNNGNTEKAYYKEGIYVGYRYFDTFDVPVRYGFGYGLSYTDFRTKVLSVVFNENEKIVVETETVNIGTAYSGREVVQIYVTCPQRKLDKEYRRLAAFGKTEDIAPGQKETMLLEFPLENLASYSQEDGGWIMEAGDYVIWAGSSLETSKPAAVLRLDREVMLQKTDNICPLKEKLEELKPEPEKAREKREALLQYVKEEGLPVLRIKSDSIKTETVIYKTNAQLIPEKASEFADTLTEDQLVSLASGDPDKGQGGNLGAAGIAVPGSAGETSGCAEKQGLAGIVLADGPAGLRLMKNYHVYEGKIVNRPFEFSFEGGIFYQGSREEPGDAYYQYCTAIPVGTLLAQTWNVDLLEETGEMIGGEMEEFGVTLWLAPGMNIHRNPLCGRNFEYYSEDPLLSGKMAAAVTRGVQQVPGCGTTIKHFACNNQEDNRMNSDSILSERALREIYLKGFEIAVKEAQPMSIMTSYNLINGVHAANCSDLCTKAARCEWGFQGVIMTDWTTTETGPDCTASGCMRAGNDLVMPGAVCDRENLKKELAEGTLSGEDLRACVSRLINIIWQSNQYENR